MASDRGKGVPVTFGENTIIVKSKMGFGAKQRVQGASIKFDLNDVAAGGVPEATLDLGAGNLALLRENIIGWDGPAFEDARGKTKPVTAHTIDQMIEDWDTEDPLLDMVLAQVNDLNKKPETLKLASAGEDVGDGEDAEFSKPELEEALSPNS